MKHVVVGIISRKNNEGQDEYLLVRSNKDFGEFTGAYYPPGGHVEEGESEQEALIREIQEELGVLITVGDKIAETLGDVKSQVTHWYRVNTIVDSYSIDLQEISAADWFTKSQMYEIKLWPATKKFFDKYFFKT